MKIIETLNSGMKKIAKGMFALFTINLLIFGGIILIQSCQTDDENFEINNVELDNFKSLVINISPEVKTTLKQNNKNVLGKSINSQDEESEAKEILQPAVTGAKKLLLSYGFSEKEISDEFGTTINKDILMAGLAILEIEKEANKMNDLSSNLIKNNDLFLMFGQSVNAQSYADFKRCALDATGIAGIGILLSHGINEGIKKLGKKAVLKIIGKALSRTLSWVGAA
tara:strand:+ start:155 stop:832 length:678 start_codon:yes stop_codon:yes gene_type:complete